MAELAQMLRFFWDVAVALDPAIEPKDERHMKLSRQGQLAELWKKAGLIDIQVSRWRGSTATRPRGGQATCIAVSTSEQKQTAGYRLS
jgi:hypothetical protein